MDINNVESYLRTNFDRRLLLTYRTVKKFYLRVELVRLDIYFLKSCRTKNIIPKFLWFKTANRNLASSPAYEDSQRRLINAEINFKYKHINNVKKMYKSSINLLQQYCSADLFDKLQQIIHTICSPVIKKKEDTIEKSCTIIQFVSNKIKLSIRKLSKISLHEFYRMMKSIVLLTVLIIA